MRNDVECGGINRNDKLRKRKVKQKLVMATIVVLSKSNVQSMSK